MLAFFLSVYNTGNETVTVIITHRINHHHRPSGTRTETQNTEGGGGDDEIETGLLQSELCIPDGGVCRHIGNRGGLLDTGIAALNVQINGCQSGEICRAIGLKGFTSTEASQFVCVTQQMITRLLGHSDRTVVGRNHCVVIGWHVDTIDIFVTQDGPRDGVSGANGTEGHTRGVSESEGDVRGIIGELGGNGGVSHGKEERPDGMGES